MTRTSRRLACSKAVAWIVLHVSAFSLAWATSVSVAQDKSDELVELNLPDNLELTILVELVSEQLELRFLYDESLSNKRVSLKTPVKVEKESPLGSHPKSRTLGIAGWSSCDAIRTSRKNRSASSGRDRRSVRRTFIARIRPTDRSFTSKTIPMPPRPISRTIS